jgi:hypothetical protein
MIESLFIKQSRAFAEFATRLYDDCSCLAEPSVSERSKRLGAAGTEFSRGAKFFHRLEKQGETLFRRPLAEPRLDFGEHGFHIMQIPMAETLPNALPLRFVFHDIQQILARASRTSADGTNSVARGTRRLKSRDRFRLNFKMRFSRPCEQFPATRTLSSTTTRRLHFLDFGGNGDLRGAFLFDRRGRCAGFPLWTPRRCLWLHLLTIREVPFSNRDAFSRATCLCKDQLLLLAPAQLPILL